MAAGTGAMKSIFNTKDFFTGGAPNYEDKTDFRKSVESYDRELSSKSPINAVVSGISEFGVAFIGVGKLVAGVRAVAKLGEVAKAVTTGQKVAASVATAVQAGVAAGVGMDPRSEHLANLMRDVPMAGPIIEAYLGADPKDDEATARFKLAMENLIVAGGIDLIVAGAVKGVRLAASRRGSPLIDGLTSSIDAIKLSAAGDTAGADAAQEAAQKQFIKAIDTGGLEGKGPMGFWDHPTETTAAGKIKDPALSFWDEGSVTPREAAGASKTASTHPTGQPAEGPVGPPEGAVGTTGPGPKVLAADTGLEGGVRGNIEAPAALSVNVTPEQVATNLERVRGDVEIANDAGSMGAAQAVGHVFTGPDLIPWAKFTSSDDVMTWMSGFIHDNADAIHKVRGGNAMGVMSDLMVERMVAQRVTAFGEDQAWIRGKLLTAGNNAKGLAADMDMAYLISQKGFQDTFTLAQKLEAKNFAGFQSEEHAWQALRDRTVAAIDMFAAAKAMTAAGARSTRRMQFTPKGAKQLAEMDISKLTGEDLKDLILVTGGDTRQMSKLKPGLLNRVVDFITMNQAAGLVSGAVSQAVNMGGNLISLYFRPGVRAAGAVGLQGVAKAVGNEGLSASAALVRDTAIKQAAVTHMQMSEAWNSAAMAFKTGDSRIAPHTSEVTAAGVGGPGATPAVRPGAGDLVGSNKWRPVTGMDDVQYNLMMTALDAKTAPGTATMQVLALPLRAMGAADEAVKMAAYRAQVMAKAHMEGIGMGLKDADNAAYLGTIGDHVRLRLDQALDAHGAALDTVALKEARETSFQGELLGPGTEDTWGGWRSFGSTLQVGVSGMPPSRLAVPFVQTIINMSRQGVRLTPGLNLLQKQYLNDIRGLHGVEAQSRATGEMMFGVMSLSLGTYLASTGRITGTGPSDPKENAEWLRQGNKPNSVVFQHDDGSRSHFSLSRFGPFIFPFLWATEATTIWAQRHIDEDKASGVAAAMVYATANLFKSETMVRNVSDFLAAMQDEKRMAAFVRRAGPGMAIPLSAIMRSVNPDPYMHEVTNVFDAFRAAIPGVSSGVAVQYDAFGDKVSTYPKFLFNQDPKYGLLHKALNDSYWETGNFIQSPGPRVGKDHFDMRDVKLEDGRTAFEHYNELMGHPKGAPSMKDALLALVSSAAYNSTAVPHGRPSQDGSKEHMVASLMLKYREQALGQLTADSKVFRDRRQKDSLDFLSRINAGQKNLQTVGSNSAAKSLNSLLAPTGAYLPVPTILPK
jgi:hypothetical protein